MYELNFARLSRRLQDRKTGFERRGLKAVMDEARARVSEGSRGFGVTLDLDAIDPEEAPGVTSPEPAGLNASALVQALAQSSRLPACPPARLPACPPSSARRSRSTRPPTTSTGAPRTWSKGCCAQSRRRVGAARLTID